MESYIASLMISSHNHDVQERYQEPEDVERFRCVRINFRLPHTTRWGQHIRITGAGALLGNWSPDGGHPMRCTTKNKETVWEAQLALPWAPDVRYRYVLRDEGLALTKAETEERVLKLPAFLEDEDVVDVIDTWQDPAKPEYLLTRRAFTDVLLPRAQQPSAAVAAPLPPAAAELPPTPSVGEVLVRFSVQNLRLEEGQAICVTGSVPALGHWVKDQALPLEEAPGGPPGVFEADAVLPLTAFPFQFKFGIRAGPPGQPLHMERGASRVLSLGTDEGHVGQAPVVVVANCGAFRYPQPWQGAGIAVPVFSLRTERSVGCGDFSDLKELAELAEACGMRLIQVLPVNDTTVYRTWWDSYPYSCVSVQALHPLYLSVQDLVEGLGASGAGGVAAPPGTPGPGPMAPPELESRRAELARQVAAARQQLDLGAVDYERTVAVKTRIASACFDVEGRAVLASEGFKRWFNDNKEWLKPYAAFSVLRDTFETAEHWRWGDMARPSPRLIDRLTSLDYSGTGPDNTHQVALTYYLQYKLHLQLLGAARYANARHVILKGDLPIGVDKRSVETWMHPHLFRMDRSTGAPPDYFDAAGQNWGFPTYDWDSMEKEGYAWFTRRMRHMAQYFQAYRLDHVLGFFRIWEVAPGFRSGVMGIFRPSIAVWAPELAQRNLLTSPEDAEGLRRLCDPHITEEYVREVFGDEMLDEVVSRYLEEIPDEAAGTTGGGPGYMHGHGSGSLPSRGSGRASTSSGLPPSAAPLPSSNRPSSSVRYRLRAHFDDEEKIHTRVRPREGWPEDLVRQTHALRDGLLRLCQNRLLVRDPEDPLHRFHPRFSLQDTESFRSLDPQAQARARDLYHDYFFERQEDLWRRTGARRLLALMSTSDMLMFGEDLGLIPRCVPDVLQDLGIIGLRIQRMPVEQGLEFANPANYPYLSVSTPSCHDVLTTRAWWEESKERRERFAFYSLGILESPPEKCTTEIMRLVLKQHVDSRAAWAIFPVQDLLAVSDRYTSRPASEEVINDPKNAKHYWQYRMHVRISTLLKDHQLTTDVQKLLVASGRCTLNDLVPFYSRHANAQAVMSALGI